MAEPRHAMVESLEARRLLSSAGVFPGLLYVRGTQNQPNTIVLRAVNNGASFQVTHNGRTQTFNRGGIREIIVLGGDQADTLRVEDVPARRFLFGVKIFGRGGDDTLIGGAGNDTISGGDGNDLIRGGFGNDRLSGDDGNDRIFGGTGRDVPNDGRDLLWGGAGDDLLVGGSWFDTLFGDAGNDRMYGGFINADPGNRNGDASDDMFGDDGDDFMHAGAGGRNRMHGMAGNDTLVGSPNNDTLYGGAGDNRVTGGGGEDLGQTNGEWRRLHWLLGKIRPRVPVEPGRK